MNNDNFDPLDVEESLPPRRNDGGQTGDSLADSDLLDNEKTMERPGTGVRTSGSDASLGDLPTQKANGGLSSAFSMGEMPTIVGATVSGIARMESVELSDLYDVQGEIGRGGFATVYKAVDKADGTAVAIKRLNTETADEQSVRRFKREARLIAELNHPNIIGVHRIGEDSQGLYIVMEYVAGGSLKDHLKQHGKMPVRDAVKLIQAVCYGLAYAHRKNLVHRDIKPANILLMQNVAEAGGQKTEVRNRLAASSQQLSTKDLIPKIADFGLSTGGFESDASMSLSMSGHSMGTPYYMPPEQRQNSKNVNHTADIYAIGKTLYQMVTGDVPDNVDPDLIPRPAGLSRIINQCVKSNPAERFFSMDDLGKALDTLIQRRRVFRPAIMAIFLIALLAIVLFRAPRENQLHEDLAEKTSMAQMNQGEKELFSGLLSEAEAALSQGNMDLAVSKISAVLENDPVNSRALSIRTQIEQRADQRKARDIKASADTVFESFEQLAISQNDYFLPDLGRLKQQMKAAELAFKSEVWGEAVDRYGEVEARCRDLEKRARLRLKTLGLKEEVDSEISRLTKMGVVDALPKLWADMIVTCESAKGAFNEEQFDEAEQRYKDTAVLLSQMEPSFNSYLDAEKALEERRKRIALLADGKWHTDWENTYTASQKEQIQSLVFLYNSDESSEAAIQMATALGDIQFLQELRGRASLIAVDLSEKNSSVSGSRFLRALRKENSDIQEPVVLLMGDGFIAEKRFMADDFANNGSLFFQKIRTQLLEGASL